MAAITISRQFGAGGRTLGEELCKRFGFRFVDEIVIDELARKANVSGDWLTAMEKEACSKLLALISSIVSSGLLYRNPSAPDEEFERNKYIAFLTRIMTSMADEGGYVLLGRGAQLVLKNHPKVFHVLLLANYEDRVKFVVERYSLPPPEAEKMIKEKERQRAAVASNIFRANIDDPKLYHIVLNTGRFPFDWAVDCVADLFSRFIKAVG
jgi:cytidylate kinase